MKYTKCKIPTADIAVVPGISQLNEENCNPHHIERLAFNMKSAGQTDAGHVLEINDLLISWVERWYGSKIADEVRANRDEGKTHLLINGNHRLPAVKRAYDETHQHRFLSFDSLIVPTGTFLTRLALKGQQFEWNLFRSVIFQRPTIPTVKALMIEWVDEEFFGLSYSVDEIVSVPSKASKLMTLLHERMWDTLKTCGGEYEECEILKMASDLVYKAYGGKRSDEKTTFRTKTQFKKLALEHFKPYGIDRTNILSRDSRCVLMVNDDNGLNAAIYGDIFRILANVHNHGKFDKEKYIQIHLAFSVRKSKDNDLTAQENATRIDRCNQAAVKCCEKINNLLAKNRIPAKIVSLNTLGQRHGEDPNAWRSRKLKSKIS